MTALHLAMFNARRHDGLLDDDDDSLDVDLDDSDDDLNDAAAGGGPSPFGLGLDGDEDVVAGVSRIQNETRRPPGSRSRCSSSRVSTSGRRTIAPGSPNRR